MALTFKDLKPKKKDCETLTKLIRKIKTAHEK